MLFVAGWLIRLRKTPHQESGREVSYPITDKELLIQEDAAAQSIPATDNEAGWVAPE